MAFQGPIESWRDPSGDGKLLVQFKVEPVLMEAKTRELKEKTGEDRPIFEDREFVVIRIPGDNNTEVIEEVSLRAGTPLDPKIRFAEQYARFKANAQHQYVGTPLEEWPGMTPARIKMLHYHNIYTVEHMADAADTAIQKMGMDGPELRKKAQAYLLKAKGAVDPEKERMRHQLEEQGRQLQMMQEQMAAIAANQKAPPVLPAGMDQSVPVAAEPVAEETRRGWPKGKPRKPAQAEPVAA